MRNVSLDSIGHVLRARELNILPLGMILYSFIQFNEQALFSQDSMLLTAMWCRNPWCFFVAFWLEYHTYQNKQTERDIIGADQLQ